MVICDEKNKELFVKVPNKMVRKLNNEESVVKINGSITLGLYCYLCRFANIEGESRTSIKEIILKLGYKPNKNKGKINEKMVNAYNWLVGNNYIIHIDGDIKKVDNLIVCKVANVDKDFFMLKLEHLDAIENVNELVVFSTILSRIPKTKGIDVEDCFPKMDDIVNDIGLSNVTIKDRLDSLQDKKILYYGNIGYVEGSGLGKRMANNVYALDEYNLRYGLKQSKKHYEDIGFKTENIPSNYKRRDKEVIENEKKEIKQYLIVNLTNYNKVNDIFNKSTNMNILDIANCNNKKDLIRLKWTMENILTRENISV